MACVQSTVLNSLLVMTLTNVGLADLGVRIIRGVDTTSKSRPPYYEWKRRRARESGLFDRPCSPVPDGKKFYMYDFESLRHCSPTHSLARRTQLYSRLLALRGFDRGQAFDLQRLGPALFFEQQLAEHPWRTLDPEEADLFVLPAVLDLAAEGLCDPDSRKVGKAPAPRPWVRVINGTRTPARHLDPTPVATVLAKAVQASPYYARKAGADHLLFFVHLQVRDDLFYKGDSREQLYIRRVFQNFIVAEALSRNYRIYGDTLSSARPLALPAPSSCMLTVPFFAPSARGTCSLLKGAAADGGDKLLCGRLPMERTVNHYLEQRDITATFVGTPRNTEWPNMRNLVVSQFGPVSPPNVLVYTTGITKSTVPLPECNYTADGIPQPAPCEARGGVSAGTIQKLLERTRFSIHVKGADSGSSRVFDAMHAGAMQIFIADRYLQDSAAFKCRVPWKDLVFYIPENVLHIRGGKAFRAAMRALQVYGRARMQQMLDVQYAAVNELLWHVPGSRTGQNVIEDALRCASVPPIPEPYFGDGSDLTPQAHTL